MSKVLQRLVELEAEIAYTLPPQPGEVEFRYQKGRIPVLLSAPHGAAHTRRGGHKDEDEYTAAIARFVAEETGAHVLYAHRKSGTDPNFYPDVPYKRMIQQIAGTERINFVLDIHGAAPGRPFGLALGTIWGKSCPTTRPLILESLRRSGFHEESPGFDRLNVDKAFPAAGNHEQETITRFAWQVLGIEAAQLEINAHLRVVERKTDASSPDTYRGDPEQILKTVHAILHLIPALTQA